MNTSKQSEIKLLMEKLNLLFRIFEKEGFEKISRLEKELLKEQVNNLQKAIDSLELRDAEAVKVEMPAPQPVKVIEAPIVPEPKVVQQVPAPEPVVKEIVPAPENLSINEQEAQRQEEKEIPQPVSNTAVPTRNMREIIDLNKSFVFKKVLFGNDNKLYDNFINELNVTQNETDALGVLSNYAKQNNWDTEEKVYELMARAIEKRFLPIL